MPKVNIEDYQGENYNPYATESMKRHGSTSKEEGRRESNRKDRALKAFQSTQQGITQANARKHRR